MASRFGVVRSFDPKQFASTDPRSSSMMRMTLGRRPLAALTAADTATDAAAVWTNRRRETGLPMQSHPAFVARVQYHHDDGESAIRGADVLAPSSAAVGLMTCARFGSV